MMSLIQFLVCQAISCRLGAWNAYTNWATRWQQDQQTMTSICYHKSAVVLTSTTCSLHKNDTCQVIAQDFRVVTCIVVQSTTVSINDTDTCQQAKTTCILGSRMRHLALNQK